MAGGAKRYAPINVTFLGLIALRGKRGVPEYYLRKEDSPGKEKNDRPGKRRGGQKIRKEKGYGAP